MLLLENSRPLSPPWVPRLVINLLGIDSLTIYSQRPWLTNGYNLEKELSLSFSEGTLMKVSFNQGKYGASMHNLQSGNLREWGWYYKRVFLWWLFIWSCKLVNEKEREKVGGDRERQVGEADSMTINLIENDTLLSAAATATRGYLKHQIHCPDQSSHCLSLVSKTIINKSKILL